MENRHRKGSDCVKRILVAALSAIMLFSSSMAANVTIDGKNFDGAKLIGSVTYVPIKAFCKDVSDLEVVWDGENRVANVIMDDSIVSAKIGDKFLENRERYIYSGYENVIIDNKTYVPIRSIGKILETEIGWDFATKTAVVKTGSETFLPGNEFYNQEDLYWLSKIISAESAGEKLEGKIAVGNVVLNRVKSDEYPNTIYEVIFDTKDGVQFTPVLNGTINNEPTKESVIAAKICLEDYKLSNQNILFFLNPQISTSTWVPDNRDFVMTIGRHDFYA